ncbi:MAG: hypothetical protein WC657_01105 [Candidatus Paceibacterota bacterium]|jgi:hypothetical protein
MFEKFFGPKNEEEVERALFEVGSKELEVGVNGPTMFHAFNAMREENKKKGYGFTNNHILKVVRECAFGHVSEIEDSLMGGRDEVYKKIDSEIERLHQDLPESERGV